MEIGKFMYLNFLYFKIIYKQKFLLTPLFIYGQEYANVKKNLTKYNIN